MRLQVGAFVRGLSPTIRIRSFARVRLQYILVLVWVACMAKYSLERATVHTRSDVATLTHARSQPQDWALVFALALASSCC